MNVRVKPIGIHMVNVVMLLLASEILLYDLFIYHGFSHMKLCEKLCETYILFI